MEEQSTSALRSQAQGRYWILWLVACIFAVWVAVELWQAVWSSPMVLRALMGGSVAALATALGTLPVLFSQNLSQRVQDTMSGFGAGVMLAASAFSLIIPGLAAARSTAIFGGGPWAAGGVIATAILLPADRGPRAVSSRLRFFWVAQCFC